MNMAQRKFPFLSITIFFSLLFIGHCSAQLFGGANSNVTVLNESEFEDKVLGGEHWFIGFGFDDHFNRIRAAANAKFGSIYDQVAGRLKGKINVGAVDADTGFNLGIRDFPVLKLYLGKGVTPIVVGSRVADQIENLVLAELLYRDEKSNVTILTRQEFKSKVVERGERWLINFSDKSKPSCWDFEGVYEYAAKMLKGQINVGVVLDPEFATTLHSSPIVISSLPTVIFYPGITVDPNVKGAPVLYTGPKIGSSLVEFVGKQMEKRPA